MENNLHSKHLYEDKIHQVITYISEHLSEEINLDKLADVACFSPFHFHRIFTAFTGETPREFIERVKLEEAANRLFLLPNKSINEIALDLGYSSASTFTRTFKKYFKIPPSEFMIKHVNDFHSLNINDFNNEVHIATDVCQPIKIEKLPTFHIAYYQVLDTYSKGIPNSWNKLMNVAILKGWLENNPLFIGVPFDNPGLTPRDKCRYRACLTVSNDIVLNHGTIKTTNIETDNYAIFHFRGETKDITNAYAYIYGYWLPQSGYIPGNNPLLELYPPELHRGCYSKILEYDIALPITTID